VAGGSGVFGETGAGGVGVTVVAAMFPGEPVGPGRLIPLPTGSTEVGSTVSVGVVLAAGRLRVSEPGRISQMRAATAAIEQQATASCWVVRMVRPTTICRLQEERTRFRSSGES